MITRHTATGAEIPRHRLRRSLGLGTLAALTLTGLTALAAPAGAATDCASDCVTVAATPSVDGVKLAVTTTTPAHVTVRIASQDGATTLATVTPGSYWVSSATLVAAGLPKQGTTYRYEAYAADTGGLTWRETGYFATEIRDVAVHFNQLQITDDSDWTGPGELVAGAQLWTAATNACGGPKDLAPLKMGTETSMSSGSPMTVGSSSDLICHGVGSSVNVQSMMADDDTDAGQDCSTYWPWAWGSSQFAGWSGRDGSNSCADWNNSNTALADPVTTYGPAAASVSFTSSSVPADAAHLDLGPQYTLTGSALFTHRAVAGPLPATTGSALRLPLTIAAGRGGFTVSWTPASVPGTTLVGYQVKWRPTGTSTWSTDVVDPALTTKTVTGLTGGAGYDLQVAALNAAGFGTAMLRADGHVTTKPLTDPTTITGWPSGSTTAKLSSWVSFSATVSGDAHRTVLLQHRKTGTTTWQTYSTLETDAAGVVASTYQVVQGSQDWRLSIPASGFSAAAASATRTVLSASAITGFNTQKASVKTGTLLKDGITVSPGAGRPVIVQYRKAGSSTWQAYATVKASATGTATLTLKAFAGSYYWRATVSASNDLGAAATTGSRLVAGS